MPIVADRQPVEKAGQPRACLRIADAIDAGWTEMALKRRDGGGSVADVVAVASKRRKQIAMGHGPKPVIRPAADTGPRQPLPIE